MGKGWTRVVATNWAPPVVAAMLLSLPVIAVAS